MKEIVLTDHFKGGGAERVASLLINGLIKIPNNEVHVCVFEKGDNYPIDKTRLTYHVLTPRKYFYLFQIAIRIYRFIKLVKHIKPNIIYSFGPIMACYVYCAVKLSGIKDIKIIDSERNDPRKEPSSKLKKKIRDICYNHANILVCQTDLAVQILKSRGIQTKYVIIPNPITPNLPEWEGFESKNIITAARLTSQKNLPLLIDAFIEVHKKHPNYKLTIYGEGELRKYLENLVNIKGLHGIVTLPGFSTNIHKVMKNAYMYVSSSNYEGISNSMLEALGIGLPCICTDCPVGGARMCIKNNVSGLLVEVGNKDQLVNAMNYLIDNKDMAMSYSRESRKINDLYSLEKITRKWIELAE